MATFVLGLSACGGSPSATTATPTVPSVEAVPSATPTPTATASQMARSPRGNLIKVAGQPAGQADPVTKKQTVSFTINSITVDPPCTGPFPRPAERGHFVILDASIETLPELAESSFPRFDLSPHTFKFVAANGTTYNGNLTSGPSYGCLPESEILPISGVGPAEKVTGKIVLDVPDTTGTLMFQPDGAGMGGWEWTF
ncbi:DUF4352 domain-containing protein [Arthrobacter sp. Z4-13]